MSDLMICNYATPSIVCSEPWSTFTSLESDVKAGNVLLDQAGIVRRCDFGAAGFGSSRQSEALTLGTMCMSSPEALEAFREEGSTQAWFSSKMDMWSLGMLAIELQDPRQHPFEEDIKPSEFLQQVRSTGYLHGLLIRCERSRDLQVFVQACLIFEFESRPTARKLLQSRSIQRVETRWLYRHILRSLARRVSKAR